MQPWGVAEARALGVEQVLLDAGAHVAPAWNHYDSDVPTEISEANPIPVGIMVPGVDGSLNLRHPEACNAEHGRIKAGAEVHRGVSDIALTAGAAPTIRDRLQTASPIEIRAPRRGSRRTQQHGAPSGRHRAVPAGGDVHDRRPARRRTRSRARTSATSSPARTTSSWPRSIRATAGCACTSAPASTRSAASADPAASTSSAARRASAACRSARRSPARHRRTARDLSR